MSIWAKMSRIEAIAFFLLAITSTFSGVIIARTLVTNADATMSLFLFQIPIHSNDILLADWHTNIIKIPFLVIQSVFPFNLSTFEVFSVFYIFSTMLGWSAVSSLVLGRRYFAPLAIFLSLLTIGSLALSNEVAFSTIRNIEYPLFFLSLYLFWNAIDKQGKKNSVKYGLSYVLITVFLGASDPFFLYIGLPAVIIQLAYYAYNKTYRLKAVFMGLIIAGGSFILSKLVIAAAIIIGLFSYYGESLRPPIYNLRELPVHAWNAIIDIIYLYGADISNMNVSLGLFGKILLLTIFIAALYVYILRLKNIESILKSNKTYASILLSSIAALGYYIFLSGFDMQYRYLVIVALVLPLPLIEVIIERKKIVMFFRKRRKIVVCVMIIVISLVGILSLRDYRNTDYPKDKVNIENMTNIASSIKNQGINTIIAGHSYSSAVAYWANRDLHYIPILFCNQNLPFLTKESWYKPKWEVSENIAMIVDRDGRDANSWQCTQDDLFAYYGQPSSLKTVPALDGKTVTILIYPKNIISKIKFIKNKGAPVPGLNKYL